MVTTAMDEKTNCDNNDNVLSYGVIVTLLLIILYPLLYISITTRSVMYIFSFAIVAILFLLILNIIPLRKETIKLKMMRIQLIQQLIQIIIIFKVLV